MLGARRATRVRSRAWCAPRCVPSRSARSSDARRLDRRDHREQRRATLRARRLRHWRRADIGSEAWWGSFASSASIGDRWRTSSISRTPAGVRRSTRTRYGRTDRQRERRRLLFPAVQLRPHLRVVDVRRSRLARRGTVAEGVDRVSIRARHRLGYACAPRRGALLVVGRFLRTTNRATFVFPRLAKTVQRLGDVLADSGPVPWAVKVRFYREAARDPALHGALAAGLARSFFDVYGSVDPLEARELFRSIVVEDDVFRTELDALRRSPCDGRCSRSSRWTNPTSDGPDGCRTALAPRRVS